MYGYDNESTNIIVMIFNKPKPKSGLGLFTIQTLQNKIFLRKESKCREDLHSFYSCKYNGIIWSISWENIVYIETKHGHSKRFIWFSLR